MTVGILSDIEEKFRELTGTGTSLQITSAKFIKFLNSFYKYDFPAKFRSLKLKDKYTFNTIQGVDVYPFDYNNWSTIEDPCFCMKRQIKLFRDQPSFWGSNFRWQQQQNFTYGNGGFGPYGGILQSTPLIRSVNNNPFVNTQTSPVGVFPAGVPPVFPSPNISRVQNILITANTAQGTLNVTDDGDGNLIGDCTAGGTIDYFSGAIANLNFISAIPAGNYIQCMYNPCQPNIPLAILFSQQQFTLSPVPNQGYTIELTAYRLPSQALLGTSDPNNPNYSGVPEIMEWWETLAIGAAMKFYQNLVDGEGEARMQSMLDKAYDNNLTRTCAEIGSQQIQTIYTGQLNNTYNANGWGFGNGIN